jgi:putative oxidoreductase
MKYVIIIVRVLLGLAFVVFGFNIFLHFIPGSDQIPPGDAGVFASVLMHSGYMYVVGALQILGGLCLLIGSRFVPLGLTLLGPVIVNIILFHIFFAPEGLPIGAVCAVLALFLLWIYRAKFPAIFQL